MERLPTFPHSQHVAHANRAFSLARDAEEINISSVSAKPRFVTGRTLVESSTESPWTYRRDVVIRDARPQMTMTRPTRQNGIRRQDRDAIIVLQRLSAACYEDAQEQMASMEEGWTLLNKVVDQCLRYSPKSGKIAKVHEGTRGYLDLGITPSSTSDEGIRLTHTTLQGANIRGREAALAFLCWLKRYTDSLIPPLLGHLDEHFAKDLCQREDVVFPWLRQRAHEHVDILSRFYTLAGPDVDDISKDSIALENDATTIILVFGRSRLLHLPALNVDVEIQPGDIVFVATELTTYTMGCEMYWTADTSNSQSWTVTCCQDARIRRAAHRDESAESTAVASGMQDAEMSSRDNYSGSEYEDECLS